VSSIRKRNWTSQNRLGPAPRQTELADGQIVLLGKLGLLSWGITLPGATIRGSQLAPARIAWGSVGFMTRWNVLGSVNRRVSILFTYGAANAQPALTAAILVMIYARAFSLADFGVYGVLGAVFFVVSILIEMGASSAILRNFYDLNQDEIAGRNYLRSVIQGTRLVSIFTLPFIVAILYFSWPLLHIGNDGRALFLVLILFAAFFDRSCQILGTVCRALDRPGAFAAGRAVQAVATIAGALALVTVFHFGLVGALAANLMGKFVSAVSYELLLISSLGLRRPRLVWEDTNACLVFGLPLVPNQLLAWGRFVALRPVLAHFVSLPMVGLFSLASALSALPTLLSQATDLAMSPLYFRRRAAGAAEFPDKARKFATLFATGLFPVWVVCIVFSPILIRLYAGSRFVEAAPVCTVLFCAAYIRAQLQFLFRQVHFLRKTWILPLTMLPSAVVSLLLTGLWIHAAGILAAGWAVLISDTLLFLLLASAIQQHERLQFPVLTSLVMLGILTLLAFWVVLGEPAPRALPKPLLQLAIALSSFLVSARIWLWPERHFIYSLVTR